MYNLVHYIRYNTIILDMVIPLMSCKVHYFCRKGDQVLLNEEGGYILRTKPANVDEGGVALGAGSLDSPNLLADTEFTKTLS